MKNTWTFLVFALFFNCCLTFTKNYDLMENFYEKPWISYKILRNVISMTLGPSKCCNVYLMDLSEETELVFNEFRKAYREPYSLNENIPTCQGYIVIGNAEDDIIEIIQNVSSVKFKRNILVVFGNEMDDRSALLEPRFYQKSHANILSVSGTWTLSENYLEPRFFKRINRGRYEEMARKEGILNMKGHKLWGATCYSPPASYFNQDLVNNVNDSEIPVFNDDDGGGVEYKLFLIFAEKWNFTWGLRSPTSSDAFGFFRGSIAQWNGSILGYVIEGEAEMAFATIWATAERGRFVNFSYPWYPINLHFLVPRPRPIITLWSVVLPFSPVVWISVVVMIFAQTVTTNIQARLSLHYPQRWRDFTVNLLEMIGRLLGSAAPEETPRSRPQMLLWHVVGLLIVTGYCSNLAAILATPQYEKRIDTVEQLTESHVVWGGPREIPFFYRQLSRLTEFTALIHCTAYIKEQLENPLPNEEFKGLMNKYTVIESDEYQKQLMENYKLSIMGSLYDSYFFPYNDTDYDPGIFRLMREPVGTTQAVFVLQPWLVDPFNYLLQIIQESGIIIYFLNEVLREQLSYYHTEIMIEHDEHEGSTKSLTLESILGAYVVLVSGTVISAVVFYFELKRARRIVYN